MNYPGYTIQQQATDKAGIKAIQRQLNERGCGPVRINGDYDLDT
jgi:hypothetical protein